MRIPIKKYFTKLYTIYIHSNYSDFIMFMSKEYNVIITNNHKWYYNTWDLKHEYLIFPSEEDYFLFLLKLS